MGIPTEDGSVLFVGPRGTYRAERQEGYWRVTLVGNTNLWMYWVIGDEALQKLLLAGRLTE